MAEKGRSCLFLTREMRSSRRCSLSQRNIGSRGSHFTGIGAFERATLGFFKVDRKDYKTIPIREQVEVISLVGNIARDEAGKPKVHAHVVLGKSDGTAHGGHLLEGWVRPTLEVVLVESERHLRRRMNPQLGIPLIDTTD